MSVSCLFLFLSIHVYLVILSLYLPNIYLSDPLARTIVTYLHISTHVYLSLSFFLFVCLSACLSASLSVCLLAWLSVCLPACLSVCLSAGRSVCLSVCLSVCPSVCLSVSVCVRICICLVKTTIVYFHPSFFLSACRLLLNLSKEREKRNTNRLIDKIYRWHIYPSRSSRSGCFPCGGGKGHDTAVLGSWLETELAAVDAASVAPWLCVGGEPSMKHTAICPRHVFYSTI